MLACLLHFGQLPLAQQRASWPEGGRLERIGTCFTCCQLPYPMRRAADTSARTHESAPQVLPLPAPCKAHARKAERHSAVRLAVVNADTPQCTPCGVSLTTFDRSILDAVREVAKTEVPTCDA